MTNEASPAQVPALSEGLGPLPDQVAHVHSDGDFCQDRYYGTSEWPVDLYTADQMRAYAAAAVAAEHARIVKRLRDEATYACPCADDANLTSELADILEAEGAGGPNVRGNRATPAQE